jgi:hypothetical protein
MPKAPGADLKTIRGKPRPMPPSRGIMHQPRQPDGPHRNPEKHARKAAGGDGAIDSRQMRNSDPGNID